MSAKTGRAVLTVDENGPESLVLIYTRAGLQEPCELFETNKGETEMKPSISRTNWFRTGLFGFAVALTLYFGAASAYAEESSVAMTFSGTAGVSAINLLPGTSTSEYNLAGNGTLGAYTFRTLSVGTPSSPPSTCSGSTHLYFSTVAGGGVFRFQDGSLLKV